MRNKTIIIILCTIVIWSLVTYYLINDNDVSTSQNNKKSRGFYEKVSNLENEIDQLITLNEELINVIKKNYSSLLTPVEKDKITEEAMLSKFRKKISPNHHNQTIHNNEFNNKQNSASPTIAILVLTCDRIAVRRCLDQLIKYRPNAKQFPIIVSQDCGHTKTSEVLRSYGSKITYIRQPDQSDIDIPPQEHKFRGYFKIARHYKWALNQVFLTFQYEVAIVVEDDLDVAPDFYEYFSGTYFLLLNDPSIWCVSAWNDNGKSNLVDWNAPYLLYRTDFFPGLGWMLTRNLWLELYNKWPRSYWDDWIRRPEQRMDRVCIRPELSRTRTFGKIGVSNGLFFEKHLKYIKLNDKYVPFTRINLTYLLKENYDKLFIENVYNTREVNYIDLKKNNISLGSSPVRISYNSRNTYKAMAKMFGVMDDFKSGVPRTGYQGIVSFFYNGKRVYLAPSFQWTKYDTNWS